VAQQRLDQQFQFGANEPVLENLRRLTAAIEARLHDIESARADYEAAVAKLTDAGLARINEVLLPTVERLQDLSTLGFLLATSGSSVSLVAGQQKTFLIDAGSQRDLFTPTKFLSINRVANNTDYAVAQLISYDNVSGALLVNILATYGNPGPFTDWQISGSVGVSEAARSYMTAAQAAATSVAQAALDAAQVHAEFVAIQAVTINPAGYAPIDSAHLTGTPTTPTATPGTNTGQIASTGFVTTGIANAISGLGNTYLTSQAAANTYLTQSAANSTYVTATFAGNTYLTINGAASTYLTQANAASTYAPKASPTFTGTAVLDQVKANNVYAQGANGSVILMDRDGRGGFVLWCTGGVLQFYWDPGLGLGGGEGAAGVKGQLDYTGYLSGIDVGTI
jgi:hypothetical protein